MSTVVRHPKGRRVRIGFVALIDAAPIIAAFELGYFAEERVDVVLSRQVGWANVRDKLAFHRLDASHALIGHPIRAELGDGYVGGPIRAVMALGTGGDAITLSQRLASAGATTPPLLKRYIQQSRGMSPLVFAHVFESSVHHYLLREWLSRGEIDPDRDVRLCVLPPPQLGAHMADRQIDGFCSGEPWNSLSQAQGIGHLAALTTDIAPAHPDKVLAVNQRWAAREPQTIESIVRAIIRGSQFCADPTNHAALAGMLSRSGYLDIARECVEASLHLDRKFDPNGAQYARAADWKMRSFDGTFPSLTHAAWMLTQMIRWGHAPATAEPWAIAAQCTETATYRAAAAALGVSCPSTDSPPMRLSGGELFGPDSVRRDSQNLPVPSTTRSRKRRASEQLTVE